MYALTFKLTKIVRWRASILRFKIRVAVMSRRFKPFSLERYSFNFCSFTAISGRMRSWYSCIIVHHRLHGLTRILSDDISMNSVL